MVFQLSQVRRILHPTDFSRGSEIAFAHALKLALAIRAELEILHVDRQPEHVPWSAFPSVRETLTRWKILPPAATEEDVSRLGISVYKASVGGSSPLAAILEHTQHRTVDMVVLASHHRVGLDRWLHRDVAGQLSRLMRTATLFVPYAAKEFVAMDDGRVSLQRVLVPFDAEPSPQPALDVVEELIVLLAGNLISCELLHVGPETMTLPAPQVPPGARGRWETTFVKGSAASAILDYAAEHDVSLIALTTQGHHGFLDALRGSTAEQILRAAPCPVLVVPRD